MASKWQVEKEMGVAKGEAAKALEKHLPPKLRAMLAVQVSVIDDKLRMYMCDTEALDVAEDLVRDIYELPHDFDFFDEDEDDEDEDDEGHNDGAL